MSKAARLSSKEIHKQLTALGVTAHISDIRLEYQYDIIEAVKLVMVKFSGFYPKGLIIREANLFELKSNGKRIKNWIAFAEPIHQNGKLMVVLLLNPVWFRSEKLSQRLKEKLKHKDITYSTVLGNICHELGHVLWYELLAQQLGFKIGKAISEEKYEDFLTNLGSLYLVTDFLLHACNELKLPYGKQTFADNLSRYAADNASEAFAESVAEYCTSNTVRPLANAIIRQYFLNYNQYKKNTD